jgi:CBS domain-containing protein
MLLCVTSVTTKEIYSMPQSSISHSVLHSLGGDLTLLSILHPVISLSPDILVAEVSELFKSSAYSKVLSLPIVENDVPLGMISRYEILTLYSIQYADQVHGSQPIRRYINKESLQVEIDLPIEQAARFISKNLQFPLTEDFIITRNGKYYGIGFVIDLLKVMQRRINVDPYVKTILN